VFCYTSWCLTRRHSASSLYSAVFVFQKSYTGNILRIGRNKSRTSYFSRTQVEVQSRDGGGPGPSHTLGRRGPGPGRATRGWTPLVHLLTLPFRLYIPSMGKTWRPDQFFTKPTASRRRRRLIRLQRIYNFWCSMLVFTPFAYYFVTLRGTFMHFPELTY
jgi:hypothetical protein